MNPAPGIRNSEPGTQGYKPQTLDSKPWNKNPNSSTLFEGVLSFHHAAVRHRRRSLHSGGNRRVHYGQGLVPRCSILEL